MARHRTESSSTGPRLPRFLGVAAMAAVACLALAAWLPAAAQDRAAFRRGGTMQPGPRAPRSAPLALPVGATVTRNVAYGPASGQVMDVYAPQGAHEAPIVFMVHGGGWQRGDKAHAGVVQGKLDYFLPRGHVLVSIDYRMLPDVDVAGEAADVADALAYVERHAVDLGGDASRIVVMGHSAGAHLVMLIASSARLRAGAGVQPWRATVALDSAAYDVTRLMRAPHPRLYDRAFGADPAAWRALSPTLALDAAPAAPALLVCSTLRQDSCAQARAYAARATGLGGTAEVLPVALRHGDIDRDVGAPGALTDAIARFLARSGPNQVPPPA